MDKIPKIFIAVLTMGDVHHLLSKLLGEIILEAKKYEVSIMYTGKLNVADNRNLIVERFLETDYDYLLMIDSDNPPCQNPVELIKYDKDVIALPTPIYIDGQLMFNVYDVIDDGYLSKHYNGKDLEQCERVGTGCVLIARRVLEKIKKPFKIIYDENWVFQESEDLSFSRRVLENGFELWVDWNYICHHFKQIDLLDIIKMAKKYNQYETIKQ